MFPNKPRFGVCTTANIRVDAYSTRIPCSLLQKLPGPEIWLKDLWAVNSSPRKEIQRMKVCFLKYSIICKFIF